MPPQKEAWIAFRCVRWQTAPTSVQIGTLWDVTLGHHQNLYVLHHSLYREKKNKHNCHFISASNAVKINVCFLREWQKVKNSSLFWSNYFMKGRSLYFVYLPSDKNKEEMQIQFISQFSIDSFLSCVAEPKNIHKHTSTRGHLVTMVTWTISFLEYIYFPYRRGAVQLTANCFVNCLATSIYQP